MISTDIWAMTEFFSVLEPANVLVNLSVDDAASTLAQRRLTRLAPATVDEVATSVQRLAEATATPGPHDVYVYYAGHGRATGTGGRLSTSLFLEGEPGGHDAEVTSQEWHNLITAPLTKNPNVRLHMIVDACESFNVLWTRGPPDFERAPKRPLPNSRGEMLDEFRAKYPTVGASVAAVGLESAIEDRDYGGAFSYALRSVAMGFTDMNHDRRITYREFAYGLTVALAGRDDLPVPGVAPPSGDGDAVFLDYSGRANVAEVCFPPDAEGRYEIASERGSPLGALRTSTSALSIYLRAGATYFLRSGFPGSDLRTSVNLAARTGWFDDLAAPIEPRSAVRGAEPPAAIFNVALSPRGFSEFSLTTQAPPERVILYVDAAAQASVRAYGSGGPGGLEWLPVVEAVGRFGIDSHYLSLGALAGWGAVDDDVLQLDYRVSLVTARLGYGYVFRVGPFEVDLEAVAGVGRLFQHSSLPTTSGLVWDARLGGRWLWPVSPDAHLALGLAADVGVQGLCALTCGEVATDWFGSAGVAAHWEFGL